MFVGWYRYSSLCILRIYIVIDHIHSNYTTEIHFTHVRVLSMIAFMLNAFRFTTLSTCTLMFLVKLEVIGILAISKSKKL